MAAWFGNRCGVDQSFRVNLAKLIVLETAEMNWLLAVGDSCSAIIEMPRKDRKLVAYESVSASVCMNHQREGNFGGSAAAIRIEGA